jgi:hypothetical protein
MGREDVLADARRDGDAPQRSAGLKVDSRKELDHADGNRPLVSLVRRFDRQSVTLGQPGLDKAAKHCVLFSLNEDELSDLTTLERVAGHVTAPGM